MTIVLIGAWVYMGIMSIISYDVHAISVLESPIDSYSQPIGASKKQQKSVSLLSHHWDGRCANVLLIKDKKGSSTITPRVLTIGKEIILAIHTANFKL
jgi:hypothetical protein